MGSLKEKFAEVKSPVANELEQIADDYAIEFAEWLIEKEREHPNKIIRVKKLLKIFKTEKGL